MAISVDDEDDFNTSESVQNLSEEMMEEYSSEDTFENSESSNYDLEGYGEERSNSTAGKNRYKWENFIVQLYI